MTRPSDEELVLHYFGEADDPEVTEALLEDSPEERARFEALAELLDAVKESLPAPERPEGYGRRIWAAVQQRLDAEDPPRRRWVGPFSRLAWPATLMVVLMLASFLAGWLWPPRSKEGKAVAERVLLAAAAGHLERSQMLLVELANAPLEATDVSLERGRAEELSGANRLYRQAASRAGAANLAHLLGELEAFLLELAHAPEELQPEEYREMRRRLERLDLLFKVRVVGSRLRREIAPSAPAVRPNADT